jgi:DNA polymerase-4
MDAFYASVEQRDNPELRGKPVAVGGSSRRGVVAAASYEARKFGVYSAMPSVTAARKCPGLIFVRHRFDVYQAVSRQIQEIFRTYTPLVEPLSLDEAYLDVTEPLLGPRSGTLIARAIKQDIQRETGLTASAGVSFNKFLAKVASAAQKPDGLTVIRPEDADAFIDALKIERFFGVGPVTAARMHNAGIQTGADLKAWSEEALVDRFGKAGRYYFRASHGIDTRPVRTDRIRKSLGAERTFFEDVERPEEMLDRISAICAEVARRLGARNLSGYTVTLKIKYHDFVVTTRQTTLGSPVADAAALFDVAGRLLRSPAPPDRPVRLLGVTVSSLQGEGASERGIQLRLPLEDALVPVAAPSPGRGGVSEDQPVGGVEAADLPARGQAGAQSPQNLGPGA